ncbi:MAG: HAD-IC family P-type ATPase [Deltaproteobacteria bacterium]|nr:HAD-IC family P-type ATPase [Deltaproteobacteria bacterium]
MQDPKPWHAMEILEVQRIWETDARLGITSAAADDRRRKVGPNALSEPPKASWILQLLNQFANPLVGALLAAAVISAIVAMTEAAHAGWFERFSDTAAILLIVIVNALLGFFQERKAEKTLDALQKMQVPSCKVIRSGTLQILDARVLVPGDLVELEAGDSVPADVRFVDTSNVEVEEAALTGESVPTHKDASKTHSVEGPVADRSNMGYLGTSLTRGKARGIVVQTGPFTELGRIGKMLESAKTEKTPLEQQLDRFGKQILLACLAISGLLFMVGLGMGTSKWTVLLLTAVSLAVAAIPEGLPAITTITLALGMQRMAKMNALVRKLPAVETLGSTTIICTDKTGTLTQNAMTVRIVDTLDGRYDVTGEGYRSVGTFSKDGAELKDGLPGLLKRLLATGAICNGAAIEDEEGEIKVVGDPTEAALVALAGKAGITRIDYLQLADVVRDIPFDSDRKRMTTVLRFSEGQQMLYSKGSADVVLPLCGRYRTEAGVAPLDDETRKKILAQNEEMSSNALRVLALCERNVTELGSEVGSAPEEELETDLVFLGLVGMIDPPRPEVRTAIAECRAAHIQVTMITGDHRATAVAIAKELGLWEEGAMAVSGDELARIDEQRLTEIVDRVRVFARVSPEDKLRIVRALKRRGHVVAMTGDGVNDAPAIKEAQIGIAMGKGGTDVARQAADMVLADDNFATIVHAVREGRAIFRNIQKFIFFLNSSNAGLCVAVIAQSFFPWMPALTPLMLLWVNLVTNGLPALALGIDPPEASQMKEKPRPVGQGIVSGRDYLGILLVGGIMGTAALFLYWAPEVRDVFSTGEGSEADGKLGRTMAFCLLALSPLFHAFNCRSVTASLFKLRTNVFLWGAVAVSAIVHLLTIFVPSLQPVFRTMGMSSAQWVLVLVLAVLPVVVIEIVKLFGGLATRPKALAGDRTSLAPATPGKEDVP